MTLLLIGLGGMCGGIARYELGKAVSNKVSSTFPLGTFLLNITGAFLLGLLSASDINPYVYYLLGDGFLGAYTTFSTFMYENFKFFKDKKYLNAFFYVTLSLVLGIIFFALGYYMIKG